MHGCARGPVSNVNRPTTGHSHDHRIMEARRAADHALTLDCSEIDSGEELTARLSTMSTRMHVGDIVLLQNVGVLAGRSPVLVICAQDRSVIVRGRHIALPKREFELVMALAAKGGRLSREMLGALIWTSHSPGAARDFAKVYVRRLRQRLGPDADVLETTRQGYRLARPFRILPV